MNARPTTTPSPPFYLGQKFIFTVNQPVICKGYPGTVTNNIQTDHMVEVKLASGKVVVSASYPDCYPVEA